jgi:hypothetical protein
MTVRQVFYQMVSRGLIEKTEREYEGTVVRLLAEMRMSQVPSHTHWRHAPVPWGAQEALRFSPGDEPRGVEVERSSIGR